MKVIQRQHLNFATCTNMYKQLVGFTVLDVTGLSILDMHTAVKNKLLKTLIKINTELILSMS